MAIARRVDKRSGRTFVKVYFDKKQLGAIDVRRGLISRSEWCRDRILSSEYFHDPLFPVASRLAAIAAMVSSERAALENLVSAADLLNSMIRDETNLDSDTLLIIGSTAGLLDALIQDMQAVRGERSSSIDEIVRTAQDILALVLERQKQERARASVPWSRPGP